MITDLIQNKIEENIGWILLNNIAKKNSLRREMYEKILELLDEYEKDENIRAIVLRGNGGNFSAGYDLSQGMPASYRDFVKKLDGRVSRRLWYGAKPTISMVEGYCLGGGFELAMGADLVYSTDDALLGEPEIDFFFTPDYNSLPCIILPRKAKEMILLGQVLSGVQAAEIGFVNHSFPSAHLEEEVQKVCRRLVSLPAETVATAKTGLNGALDAQGFGNAISYGEEIAIYNGLRSETNPQSREFHRTVKDKGLKEAIKRFRDYSQGDNGDGWKK
ncbi:MAG: enoyl-CoA hydratase/isomerase family protein [bacterium]|nr:enoyl-CoA hydratase/isomerase family protein [bacterium]